MKLLTRGPTIREARRVEIRIGSQSVAAQYATRAAVTTAFQDVTLHQRARIFQIKDMTRLIERRGPPPEIDSFYPTQRELHRSVQFGARQKQAYHYSLEPL